MTKASSRLEQQEKHNEPQWKRRARKETHRKEAKYLILVLDLTLLKEQKT